MAEVKSKDVLIIGGGIVGLATAYQLMKRLPGHSLTILEKESKLALHQTGHNSGVLHSGIYYEPGSMKATNCREGKAAMERFCEEEGVPYDVCGKVIIATDESELPSLQKIYDRGLKNGVDCEVIGPERLAELEPHAAGIKAIHVPETGIVDYRVVCRQLADRIHEMGGEFVGEAKVTGFRDHGFSSVVVETTAGAFEGKIVINCAGLYSDVVAKASGAELDAQIIPFRGEYFDLEPEAQSLVKNLIYPVPDPNFPFLGVHFTRMIGGGVECGPNAVFAFAREGYSKWKVDLGELKDSLTYPGFLRMALKYWRAGAGEMWRSVSKKAFVHALQRLVPEIQSHQLDEAPAGVRAQAISRDGKMVDDFLIVPHDRVINVCNAPSPAATASLNIGKKIVNLTADRLG